MARDNDNTLSTATRLGRIGNNESRSSSGSIDARSTDGFDFVDFYSFTLDNVSTVELNLSNLSANADLFLIRDVNGDSLFNGFDNEIIDAPRTGGNASESIEIAGLGAGDYFIGVMASGGVQQPDSVATNYNLSLETNPEVFVETEPNSSIRTADILPGRLNGNRLINGGNLKFDGNFRTADVEDFYRIEVKTPTKLTGVIAPSGGDARLSLIRDFNNDGLVNSANSGGENDLLTVSRKSGSPIGELKADRLEPGTYYLRADKNLQQADVDYAISLAGEPIARAEMKVFVQSARARDEVEGNGADFYVKATIDGEERRTETVSNSNSATFNTTLSQGVSPGKRFIPIKVELFDEDPLNPDDRVDINPTRGRREITFTYDTLTGRTINGNTANASRKIEGQQIISNGVGEEQSGSIRFSVQYETFAFGSSSNLRSASAVSSLDNISAVANADNVAMLPSSII